MMVKILELFWINWSKGIKLILSDGENKEEIGGVRKTKNGFDAWAKTFGYDPGRAIKGLNSLDEGREFVESFQPWDLYDLGRGLVVEPDVRND
tara:strand:- start:304 stop:582 length:279 start_codon:yes stop_codon:yes gene_type:complete